MKKERREEDKRAADKSNARGHTVEKPSTNSKQKKKKKTTDEDSFVKTLVMCTPKRMKKEIATYELSVTKQMPWICVGVCILVAAMLSYAYSLTIEKWVLTIGVAIICSGTILIEMMREKNEKKKFNDINSYAQQFISGMQLKHKILPAIENTIFTFPTGKMHTTLQNALSYVYTSVDANKDPLKTQAEALLYIDKVYPNSQTPTIHEFAKRVELEGGSFEKEMELLNVKREKWENRIEHEQAEMKTTLISSVIMYVAMLLVCVMVCQSMPDTLVIKDIGFVQWAEAVAICGVYPFAYMCFKTLRKGWLKEEYSMGKEEADKYLDYLENYTPRKERKKGIIAGCLCMTVTILLALFVKNMYITMAGMILTLVGFNFHNIQHSMVLKKVQKEMMRSLPKWLFDVCLCMQKSSIVESIERSRTSVPPILERDVERFLEKLKENPAAVAPYIEFLAPYGITTVSTTMRALLSIANGTGGDSGTQMKQLIEHNLNLLDEQDAADEEVRRMASLKYSLTSSMPGSVVMLFYLGGVLVKVFATVNSVL